MMTADEARRITDAAVKRAAEQLALPQFSEWAEKWYLHPTEKTVRAGCCIILFLEMIERHPSEALVYAMRVSWLALECARFIAEPTMSGSERMAIWRDAHKSIDSEQV